MLLAHKIFFRLFNLTTLCGLWWPESLTIIQFEHDRISSAGLSASRRPDRGPDVNEQNLRINYTTIDGLIILYDYLIMKEA